MSLPVKEKVIQLLMEMMEKLISPFKSPWALLIALVQKKNGSMGFYVDYRIVNEVTRRDAYLPMHPQD